MTQPSMQPLWRTALSRHGLKLALTVALLPVALATNTIGSAGAQTPAATPSAPQRADAGLVYIGSQGNQIRALRFDAATGKVTPIGPVAEGLRPTWTIAHPRLPVLYAVNDDRTKEGSVTAYAIDRATGSLAKINEAPTGGAGSTYLSLDGAARTVFAANFGGGSASSIAVNGDGSLGALVSTIASSGTGPHPRQAAPHAHAAVLDPSGHYLLVPALGADRVFVYAFDGESRKLAPDDAAAPHAFAAPAGSGPRHLAFGADGRYVYVLNELTAELMALRWDPQHGRLALVQTVQTSSEGFQGTKSGAEIGVSRDGRYAYVANRGEARIVVYRINRDSGELTFVQRVSSGGEVPWAFALHPSGKWLLVAHQKSGKVNVLAVDPASGEVKDTGEAAEVATPTSVTFVQ